MTEKSLSDFDMQYMRLALDIAKKGSALDEVPVGAVIVSRDKKILAQSCNRVEQERNPTLHAEIVAINEATKFLNSKNLSGCSIYVTMEPCAMCASAISYSRISKIYYGSSDKKFGAIENGVRFFESSSSIFIPEIYSGILESESSKMMQEFFIRKR